MAQKSTVTTRCDYRIQFRNRNVSNCRWNGLELMPCRKDDGKVFRGPATLKLLSAL